MVDREVDGQHAFSMLFFFDIFDGWSIVKLMGLCGWSQVGLGAFVCGPELLWGRVLAVFGRTLAILGRSWASAGGPGPVCGPL